MYKPLGPVPGSRSKYSLLLSNKLCVDSMVVQQQERKKAIDAGLVH